MGYDRGDNRYGGGNDRWRDRDDRPNERSSYGEQDLGRGYRRSNQDWGGDDRDRQRGGDDRGFFERAGEQVRSWFGDDDDNRGGSGRYERERGSSGGGWSGGRGEESFGGGWGNQSGWNERQGWGGERSRGGSGGFGGGWGGSSGGGSDQGRYGDFSSAGGGSSGMAETWGGSGFGGLDDNGRRFDRVDAGSVGTQGAHPMSSPVGGAYTGQSPGMGSSGRSAAIMANARGGQQGQQNYGGGGFGGQQGGGHQEQGFGGGNRGQQERGFGGGSGGQQGRGSGLHDPHYSEWRNRQIQEFDRDYDEYRREHQSKFEQEFGGWRQKRQGQRQSMSRVTEQMEVIGSDGQHIGTVDKLAGDRIILTKNDENAGGRHHSIPCSWIENVEDKVTVNKTAEEAMKAWQDEERNRALFEREDQGSEGPHMLNRSFSGTYSDRND